MSAKQPVSPVTIDTPANSHHASCEELGFQEKKSYIASHRETDTLETRENSAVRKSTRNYGIGLPLVK